MQIRLIHAILKHCKCWSLPATQIKIMNDGCFWQYKCWIHLWSKDQHGMVSKGWSLVSTQMPKATVSDYWLLATCVCVCHNIQMLKVFGAKDHFDMVSKYRMWLVIFNYVIMVPLYMIQNYEGNILGKNIQIKFHVFMKVYC